jgi:hypothetical protein
MIDKRDKWNRKKERERFGELRLLLPFVWENRRGELSWRRIELTPVYMR